MSFSSDNRLFLQIDRCPIPGKALQASFWAVKKFLCPSKGVSIDRRACQVHGPLYLASAGAGRPQIANEKQTHSESELPPRSLSVHVDLQPQSAKGANSGGASPGCRRAADMHSIINVSGGFSPARPPFPHQPVARICSQVWRATKLWSSEQKLRETRQCAKATFLGHALLGLIRA